MNSMPGRSERWFDLALVAIATLFLAIRAVPVAQAMSRGSGSPFFDWTFYAGAVHRWLGGQPIYPGGRISTLGSAAGSSYAYPPASVPLFLPFAADPWGAWLWETLVVVVLLSGLAVVMRRGWPDRPLVPLAIAVAGLAFFNPALEGLSVANVNVATAGALGWTWAVRRSAVPLGAVGAVEKVFAAALAAPGGVRALAASLTLAGLITVITLPLVGVSAWTDYVHGVSNVEPACGSGVFNPSVACLTAPLLGSASTLAGLALGGVGLLLALHAGRTVLGMIGVVIAIIAPAAELHGHYLICLYVLGWIAIATVAERRRSDQSTAGRSATVSIPLEGRA